MNRLVMTAFAALAALAARADDGDPWLTFSSTGPDRYADGATVLDGECYALVWAAKGSFGGIAADGSPVSEGDRILDVQPVARGGRCPFRCFTFPRAVAEELAAAGAGGCCEVVLLDTRVAGEGGVTNLAAQVDGMPGLVNGWGRVEGSLGLGVAKGVASGGAAEPAAARSMAAAPEGAAQPKIVGFRIEGDEAVMLVENLGGYVRAQGGGSVSEFDTTGPAKAGDAGGRPIELRMKTRGASGFYKAVGGGGTSM